MGDIAALVQWHAEAIINLVPLRFNPRAMDPTHLLKLSKKWWLGVLMHAPTLFEEKIMGFFPRHSMDKSAKILISCSTQVVISLRARGRHTSITH